MLTNFRSIDMLKNEIKNYTEYIKYKIALQDKIDDLWYELSGVKGVRYDKLPAMPNPSNEKQHALMDKLDYYQAEFDRVDRQIRFIDSILDRLNKEENELIRYVLIDGHTLIEAGERWCVTNTAISKRIDTILHKALGSNFNH